MKKLNESVRRFISRVDEKKEVSGMDKVAILDIWGFSDDLDEVLEFHEYTYEDLETQFESYVVRLDGGNGVTLYKNYPGPLLLRDYAWIKDDLWATLSQEDCEVVMKAFENFGLFGKRK